MFRQVCLILALLVSIPAWSQVPSAAAGGPGAGGQMLTPPPVNSEAYSNEVGSEARSNYLRGSVMFSPSYSNDVVGAVDANPVSDVGYSLFSSIAMDKATPRLHWTMAYSPGFTIYQHTSSENQVDQILTLNFKYRLTPHITFSLRDSFQKSSNILNQANPLSGVAVPGSPQPPVNAVIELVGDQLANIANTELTYQFSRNGMVGAQATFTNLDFLNPTKVVGLYDSSSSGGLGFYSHRLSRKHYVGATYSYSKTLAYPPHAQTELQANTIFFFYTIYLSRTFSFSFTAGPQHYDIAQLSLPAYGAWSPTITASMAWQGLHTNFAAGYSRAVSGGGGLVGVFLTNRADASARWQLARTWNLGSAAVYAANQDVTPSSYLSTGGGNSIAGTVSLAHQLSERFKVEFGYTGLHQSYSGIPVISNAPFINRESISISYNFSRPLGG
jgi:hypothetical protein